jgi:hypothetical protein
LTEQFPRKCSKCGSGKIYTDKNGREHWYHDKHGNLICDSCYGKKWREQNKEHCSAYGKEWRVKNRDYMLVYYKKWREQNRDYYLAYYRKWYEKNKDYCLAQSRKWRTEHPEYVKIYQILYTPRRTAQQRIKRALKRGYGWIS